MDDITGLGRGNPALQTLFKSLENYQPDQIPSPQERQGALSEYVSATRGIGSDERSPLQVLGEGALASGFPSDPFTAGTTGLKALIDWEQNQRESAQKQRQIAANLQYDDILQRRKDAQTALLAQARGTGLGGNARPIKLADGTWGVFDPITRSVQPIAASQAAALDKDYDTYYKLGEKALDTTDPQVVHDWVMEQLGKKAALREANPMQTPSGREIGVPQAQLQADIPEEPSLDLSEESLPAPVQQEVERLVNRLQANPSPELHKATMARLLQLQEQYGGQSTQTAAPSTPRFKSAQTQAEKEGYGEETGKQMAGVSQELQQTSAAAQSLLGDVNMMSELYTKHGENIPEGEQANLVANVKSSLKTFGVDIEGAGITDVVRALGTKQALKSRTADGQNLLPGAMSNYEDMLLQKMSPTLTMTQEGRLLMLQIIKAQLQMKVDLAAAAREYVRNKGRLDEGWYEVADRYARANPFLNEKRIQALEEYTKRLMTKGK